MRSSNTKFTAMILAWRWIPGHPREALALNRNTNRKGSPPCFRDEVKVCRLDTYAEPQNCERPRL